MAETIAIIAASVGLVTTLVYIAVLWRSMLRLQREHAPTRR